MLQIFMRIGNGVFRYTFILLMDYELNGKQYAVLSHAIKMLRAIEI